MITVEENKTNIFKIKIKVKTKNQKTIEKQFIKLLRECRNSFD